MAARPARPPARRPGRAGVSVETREMVDGTERFYARHTDPRGKRLVVKSPDGRSSWADWGEAFTAACVARVEAERLSYRSRDGERLLFRDLVRDHYLPSFRDASPNTRKNTASHLGDGSGVPTRHSPTADRAARTQLLFAFGHLPIGAIGPNEVQQWISQMSADGYEISTLRAKRSLLRTVLQAAVDQGWLVQNVVNVTRLPRAAEKPYEDRVITPRNGPRSDCSCPAKALCCCATSLLTAGCARARPGPRGPTRAGPVPHRPVRQRRHRPDSEHGKAHTYALRCRCPYCRNANTEARFWARRAKGAQPAAPWLDAAYLADRGDAVDPVEYHWFSR